MRKRETDKQVNNKSHGQIGTGGSTIGEALAATQMTLSNSRQNSTGDDEVWRKTSQTGNAKYYEQFAALCEQLTDQCNFGLCLQTPNGCKVHLTYPACGTLMLSQSGNKRNPHKQ